MERTATQTPDWTNANRMTVRHCLDFLHSDNCQDTYVAVAQGERLDYWPVAADTLLTALVAYPNDRLVIWASVVNEGSGLVLGGRKGTHVLTC